MDDGALLDSLFELIRNNRAQNASTVAAFTILMYDCLLTFNKEIIHIWKSSWTFPKCLYLYAKYYGLAYLWGGPIIFTTLVNIILGLRLYALYQSSKISMFYVLFILDISAELWGSVNSILLETRAPLLDLGALEPYIPDIDRVLPGCTFEQLPSFRFTLASYIPNLFVSGIFFCLVAYRCFKSAPWKSWFSRRDYKGLTSNGSFTPGNIVAYFIRDAAILITMMTTVLRPELSGVFIP
ncbi:hypothetical protein GYMLUDRAFT_73720 [Collybiopsis luxurians FD-317 M1]|uniref:DUF6533 domain-containing protein n=1 Tax=Collybiopsis luxurians FD-317 M1 TaxID=944289 RepID=A0A0D0CPW1_9AGAR|nr:hypothetical protein GYMLUDRAFT_73720 [Collybiopsis luxurians FD-317 M1]